MKKRNLLHIATSLLIAALVVAACNKKIEPPDAETSEVIEMTTETSAMHEIETEVTTEVTTVETTEETTEKMEEETITEPVAEIEILEDITYRITKTKSEGESSDRGYYVFNMPENDLKYAIIVSSDDGSETGYGFDVTDIKFVGSVLTITVEECKLDSVFEKGSWPCTSVEIDKFPDDVIVMTTDNEILDRIYVYMRDEEISDDYTAVFYDDGGQDNIFVYELEDGRYKWLVISSFGDINPAASDKIITGFGLAENKEELKKLVSEHSCRIFTYPGETDCHTTDEF
ncbi:MAG: hypothetical protein J6U23_08210 [Clostridiales bacterium]|nr:hypothetical protein [Clostridiales bacterium]